MRSIIESLQDLRYKRNLVRAKKVYNKTRNAAKTLAVFRYNPNTYIVRTNMSGRLLRNRNDLINHLNALGIRNIKNATVIRF